LAQQWGWLESWSWAPGQSHRHPSPSSSGCTRQRRAPAFEPSRQSHRACIPWERTWQVQNCNVPTKWQKHAPSQMDRSKSTLHITHYVPTDKRERRGETQDSLQRIFAVEELVVIVRTFREGSRFVTSEQLGEILQHGLVLRKRNNRIVTVFRLDNFWWVLPSLQQKILNVRSVILAKSVYQELWLNFVYFSDRTIQKSSPLAPRLFARNQLFQQCISDVLVDVVDDVNQVTKISTLQFWQRTTKTVACLIFRETFKFLLTLRLVCRPRLFYPRDELHRTAIQRP
jgi:hypothetical protein